MKYDPRLAPDPATWLAADEGERLRAIEACHRIAGVKLSNLPLHAAMHGVVENQLAMGDNAVCATLARLMAEGLDRHEALHAISSVLAHHILAAMRDERDQPAVDYAAELETLSAKTWRRPARR